MLWCAACLMAGIAIGLEPVLADLTSVFAA